MIRNALNLAFTIALFFVPVKGWAGTLRPVNTVDCSYVFEGKILPGDSKQLEIIEAEPEPTFVCLSSKEGGNLAEGLKFFEYFWNNSIATVVRNGDSCISACALAFMGGNGVVGTDTIRYPMRYLEPGATIGFHAPSLEIGPANTLRAEIVNAQFAGAVRIASRLFDLSRTIERNVQTFPDFLLGKILRTPPNELYIPNTVADMVLLDVVPYWVKVERPQGNAFVQNVCLNLLARDASGESYLRMTDNALSYYKVVLGEDVLSDEGKEVFDVSKMVPKKIRKDENGAEYWWMGPFFSGTKYQNLNCMVALGPNSAFVENAKREVEARSYDIRYAENIYEESEMLRAAVLKTFNNFGNDNKIPPREVERDLEVVPTWFMFAPDAEINKLPHK
jgi:hypothetical protein